MKNPTSNFNRNFIVFLILFYSALSVTGFIVWANKISDHLPTFPSSHTPTFPSSHLPTFSSSPILTFSSSHLPTFSHSHTPVIIIDNTSWLLAVDHIKHHETLSVEPYEESGRFYVGYGHQIRKGETFQLPMSEELAEKILLEDLSQNISATAGRYNLFGNQALALGLMAYNRGASATCSGSLNDLLRMLLQSKDIFSDPQWRKRLSDCWMSYNRFNGKPHTLLTQRRRFELDLFFSPNLESILK